MMLMHLRVGVPLLGSQLKTPLCTAYLSEECHSLVLSSTSPAWLQAASTPVPGMFYSSGFSPSEAQSTSHRTPPVTCSHSLVCNFGSVDFHQHISAGQNPSACIFIVPTPRWRQRPAAPAPAVFLLGPIVLLDSHSPLSFSRPGRRLEVEGRWGESHPSGAWRGSASCGVEAVFPASMMEQSDASRRRWRSKGKESRRWFAHTTNRGQGLGGEGKTTNQYWANGL
jgi:hypothetical protein